MEQPKLYSYELKTTLPKWPIRKGLILHWNGGWGEIAPLPGFSAETLDDARAEIERLLPDLASAKPRLPSVRFGIAAASRPFSNEPLKIPLAALNDPRPGFSTLKLKLGHLSIENAVRHVKQFLGSYKLRLDCNRSWSLDEALFFASHFSPEDFEYLEEPLRTFPDLIRFSELTGFPIAVDESLAFPCDKIPTLKAKVIKPTIVGSIPPSTVLSSAYESSLGLLQIARCFEDGAPPAGLDTFRFFQEDLLNPPLRIENGFLIWPGTNACPIDMAKLYHLSKITCTSAQRILPRTEVWSLQQTQRVCKSEDEGPQVKDARNCASYFLINGIMCPLKEAAQQCPLLPAFEAMTFQELDRMADEMARALEAAGVRSGDRVAFRHPPCAEVAALFFAVWRIGASICPLSLRLPLSQIEPHLERLDARCFIDSFPLGPCIRKASSSLPYPAALLFTSGSTSAPKIAVLSLSSLLANAETSAKWLGLRPGDRWLLNLPLYHVGGIGILLRCVSALSCVVCDSRDPEITHVSAVPTQLYRATPAYKRLRCLLIGGAPISSYPARLPCVLSYGLTEMGSLVAAGATHALAPLPGREVRLSEDGEIQVRGSCRFQGYWEGGRIAAPFDKEGWFATGDLGRMSEEGLTILGRKDWLFISGGENIQPEEIETALLAIEGVVEAAAFPINDPEFGQRPAAFLKLSYRAQEITTEKENISLGALGVLGGYFKASPHDEARLRAALAERLPKFKIPSRFFFVDELPKIGLKINRKEISEMAKKTFN